jgi:DNA primase
MVIDLDPAPDVSLDDVIAGAREIGDWLQDLGLVSFCKTPVGKGLYVVTPIDAKGTDWPMAKALAMKSARPWRRTHRIAIRSTRPRRGGTGVFSSTIYATIGWR